MDGHCNFMTEWAKWADSMKIYTSKSEQAPESGFHPREESTKIDCCVLRPKWCNKKN